MLDGIAEAMTKEEDKTRPEDQATNEYKSPHIKHLQLKRGEKALNDHLGRPEMMYKAYWPLMPLRRGFTPGKCIADSKWRQLFLFHDNRFCHDQTILFHAANIIVRHAVNKSVHAGIKPNRRHSLHSKKRWHHPVSRGTREGLRQPEE